MRTKYCSRCGSILENGAEYCGECGARVTDATDNADYGFNGQAETVQPPLQESAVPQAEETASTPINPDTGSTHTGFSNWQTGSAPAAPASPFTAPPQNAAGTGGETQANTGIPYGGASWQSAAPFEAPKAPGVQPPADYWQNGSAGAPAGGQGQQPYWQSGSQPPQNGMPTGGYVNNGYTGGFQQANGAVPPPAATSGQKTASLILGVIAIVFGLIFPFVSYPCGIIGLVLASKGKKAGENTQAGMVCCIIGLVLAVLNSVLGVLIALIGVFGQYYY